MTNELKQELLKAHIYGHTNEQIAAVTGLTAEEVAQTIADSAGELAEKRAHISTMTTTPLGTENALSTVKAAVGGKVYYGIDVSVWNGYVDWKAVKAAGKSFAFIRSGYGNTSAYPKQIDARFATNVKNAKAAGIAWGVYHYMYATTTAAAKAEGEAFVKQLNGVKPIPHLVLLDIEENAQTQLPAEQGRALVKAFMDVVEAAGYYTAIYTFDSYAQKLGSDFCKRYVRWIANISRSPSSPYDGWQYSWTGRVNGCSGDVDLDKTAIDYPAKIKAAGKNGYKKPESKQTLDTTGFKRGNKSLGVYYLKRYLMKHLGYSMSDDMGFGAGTEKAVNDILRKGGYKENGIAGENFARLFIK